MSSLQIPLCTSTPKKGNLDSHASYLFVSDSEDLIASKGKLDHGDTSYLFVSDSEDTQMTVSSSSVAELQDSELTVKITTVKITLLSAILWQEILTSLLMKIAPLLWLMLVVFLMVSRRGLLLGNTVVKKMFEFIF